MSKGGSSAPKPDPKIGEAALLQAETGVEWLAFAKDAFAISNERQAELDALTEEVTRRQLAIGDEQAGWARADRERYESDFKPLEDEFLAEAKDYASPERQAAAAAEAKADVQSAAAVAKATAQREAAALGINPASGRFAGIDRAGEMGTALATAGAANTARQGVRDKGLALKADAVNLGRGLPAQSAQATALGLSANTGAVGINQATNSQYLASTGIMNQGYQGQMAGYAGQANTLQNLYNSEIDVWRTQQQIKAQNAAGIGSALGGIFGLFMSDEDVKEDKVPIEDGAALDAVNAMPVEEWTYKEGVADEGRHVGPYAQDFAEATGKGDGRTIAVQDALGITMKAVQDLDDKVERIADAVGMAPPAKAKASKKKPAGKPAGLGLKPTE